MERDFQSRDLVLNQDARREDKVKHGKFDNLWMGTYLITKLLGNNTYELTEINVEDLAVVVNGRLFKFFFMYLS